ncbi:hypothetical protein IFVP22_C220224 [Vibrio parahaemolyticus]
MPAEKTIEVIQDITKSHLNWHSVAITGRTMSTFTNHLSSSI